MKKPEELYMIPSKEIDKACQSYADTNEITLKEAVKLFQTNENKQAEILKLLPKKYQNG